MTYSRAFHSQAEVDFRTYLLLRTLGNVPRCHKLQFLHIACEKLSKAYLAWRVKVPPEKLPKHGYVGSTFNLIIQVYLSRDVRVARWAIANRVKLGEALNRVAREIDQLCPSGKAREGGQRPDNCEYPWAWSEGGSYTTPRDHGFPNLERLLERTGKSLPRRDDDEFHRLVGFALEMMSREFDRLEHSGPGG